MLASAYYQKFTHNLRRIGRRPIASGTTVWHHSEFCALLEAQFNIYNIYRIHYMYI